MSSKQLETSSMQDDQFSYDGYQVVRGEFFAHIHEPSITFNNCKISVNMACIKKLPDVHYVQILVNPQSKKLAVRPCNDDAKDSFVWRTAGTIPRPKQITCRVFFAKIMEMMGWNGSYRYKLLGKLISSCDEYLFLFDLTAPEVFERALRGENRQVSSSTPKFPLEWQHQFGLPMEEHRQALQVDIFKDYAVFHIADTTQTDFPQDSEVNV